MGLPAAYAQDASGAQPGAVQMPADELAIYNNAWTMPDAPPAPKVAALEAYLAKYPQSAVKSYVLEAIVGLELGPDPAKALDAADRLLQVDPNNLKGLFAEAYLRKNAADALTDAAAKQAGLDAAAGYAQKGLAAPKPASMKDADFATLQTTLFPTLYSVIGYDAFVKKDYPTAIDTYKKELASVPVAQTQTPGPQLQDTFYLGQAYYFSTPPDLLDCTFYASRAVAFAPDNYKTLFSPTAKYCYNTYHGAADGYDAVVAAATANLNPPAGFSSSVKPAPTPADIINGVFASTPDLSTLNPSDKEFILQNGTPEQAAKVWDTMKGKSLEFPDVLVIASTPTQIQVALTDGAKASKTADFTFNLAPPDDADKKLTPLQEKAAKKQADAIAAASAVGQTVTLDGTYDSYAPKPIMITMINGVVVLPKAAAKTPAKAPVHHTAPKKQ